MHSNAWFKSNLAPSNTILLVLDVFIFIRQVSQYVFNPIKCILKFGLTFSDTIVSSACSVNNINMFST